MYILLITAAALHFLFYICNVANIESSRRQIRGFQLHLLNTMLAYVYLSPRARFSIPPVPAHGRSWFICDFSPKTFTCAFPGLINYIDIQA